MIFQDPFACLHPMYRVGDQIAEAVRAHDEVSSRRREERAVELLDGGRDPERAGARARLPAPVLGRHAPARDDRDGARPQPRRADRRRADDRARRDRAGADPRADRPREEGVRHRRDPDHARPRRRRRDRTHVMVMYAGRAMEYGPAHEIFNARSIRTRGACSSRCRRSRSGSSADRRSRARRRRCSTRRRAAPSIRAASTASRRATRSGPPLDADPGRPPRRLPPPGRAQARDLGEARSAPSSAWP